MDNLKLPLAMVSGSKPTGTTCRAFVAILDAEGNELASRFGSGDEGLEYLAITNACNQHDDMVGCIRALQAERDMLKASIKQIEGTNADLVKALAHVRPFLAEGDFKTQVNALLTAAGWVQQC